MRRLSSTSKPTKKRKNASLALWYNELSVGSIRALFDQIDPWSTNNEGYFGIAYSNNLFARGAPIMISNTVIIVLHAVVRTLRVQTVLTTTSSKIDDTSKAGTFFPEQRLSLKRAGRSWKSEYAALDINLPLGFQESLCLPQKGARC